MEISGVRRVRGFTLIELMIVVAILVIIISAFYWMSSPQSKIKDTNFLALKQVLIVNIPQELNKYYLRSSTASWRTKVSEIEGEMEDWVGLEEDSPSAKVYSTRGLKLSFTTNLDEDHNNELKDLLKKLPMVQSVEVSDTDNKKFVVKYKIN